MNSPKKYFYTDSRVASLMEDWHGVKIGKTIFPDADEYHNEYEGLVWADDGGSAKHYIHPESLHLLQPQDGDLDDKGYIFSRGRWVKFNSIIEEKDWKNRIIQRNGKAFMWPEVEA